MTNHFDNDDFLSEMSDVKPISQDKVKEKLISKNIEPNSGYRKKAAQSFTAKDQNFLTDGEVETVDPQEVLSFKLDGIQPGVFKKLRQGKYDFDYHLDLHRKTVAEAREQVYQLLRSSARYNYRVLLITHGKGLKSNPPARLKSYLNQWLKQVDLVLAFHSAQARHGGTGSVYVLLRKPREVDKINRAKYD